MQHLSAGGRHLNSLFAVRLVELNRRRVDWRRRLNDEHTGTTKPESVAAGTFEWLWSKATAAISCTTVGILVAACSSPTAPPKPPPVADATPPVIRSISVPSSRVEAGQAVMITAVVEDAESPLTSLGYSWSASVGTISGAGLVATWTIPHGITKGLDVTVTLVVTESYEIVENNQIVKRRFVVSSESAGFRVHDSEAEARELARRFLIDLFGNSSVPPSDCLADFSDLCASIAYGKNDELNDIIANRDQVVIRQATMLLQRSEWRSADFGYIHNAVLYDDYYRDGRLKAPTCGDFEVSVIYGDGRWWLCTSRYFSEDLTGCPAMVDNRLAGLILGDSKGRSFDVFDLIKSKLPKIGR